MIALNVGVLWIRLARLMKRGAQGRPPGMREFDATLAMQFTNRGDSQ
jgi:hypothetical protein